MALDSTPIPIATPTPNLGEVALHFGRKGSLGASTSHRQIPAIEFTGAETLPGLQQPTRDMIRNQEPAEESGKGSSLRRKYKFQSLQERYFFPFTRFVNAVFKIWKISVLSR